MCFDGIIVMAGAFVLSYYLMARKRTTFSKGTPTKGGVQCSMSADNYYHCI
jgi:hypothetical protein